MVKNTKQTYTIDTNIIVRLLTEDDQDQLMIAREVFLDMKQDRAAGIIHHGIINEILFVIGHIYGIENKHTIKQLITIMQQPYIVNPDKQLIIHSLRSSLKHNISFMDSYLREYSKIHQSTVITFDKKLSKLSTS